MSAPAVTLAIPRPAHDAVQRYVDIIQESTGSDLSREQAVALIHALVFCAAHLDEELGGDGSGPFVSLLLIEHGLDESIELLRAMQAKRDALTREGKPS